MALEKIQVVDQIEVVGEYSVQVREVIKVMDNGFQVGGDAYHRHVVQPNSDWSNEDAKVKKICDALFDADCIEAYFVSQNGYPSGDPSSAWSKADIQAYMDTHNISYNPSDTKPDLLEKIEHA